MHMIYFFLEPSEFLTEISGKFGPYALLTSNVITSLMLVTNEDRYGPFGFVQGTPFCTNLENDWAIVGFFARAERYCWDSALRIDHIKSGRRTRAQKLLPKARVVPLLSLFLFLFFSRCYKAMPGCLYIHTA
jgi:hypothetical protein